MKCASDKVNLSDVSDFFDPRTLARVLGVAEGRAYQLVKTRNFPARRIGKKWVINKQAFIEWWNRQ